MQRMLSALFPSGGVVELRCPDYPRRNVATAGYYDDYTALVTAAARMSGRCPGVYITLNELPPSLLARINNRLEQSPKNTTSDGDIVRRHWLFVDIDPVRPAGIPANETERKAAHAARVAIRGWLSGEGWPMPIEGDSGNGVYLLYKIDLPNNGSARILLQRCLQALAFRFDSEAINVDKSCFNAARIAKLLGTLSGKGDGAQDRPHRLSQLLSVPAPMCLVPVDLLEALSRQLPPPPPKSLAYSNGFDLGEWIERHNLPVAFRAPWEKGHRWILNPCPWNDAHTNRSAYIVQFDNGAIAAGCHHNGCQGHDWHALRDLYEPGWRDRRAGKLHFSAGEATAEKQSRSETRSAPNPTNPPRKRGFERRAPYKPFPIDALAGRLGEYVGAAASAIGCDNAFVAIPALAVCAAAIGNSRAIELKKGWMEPSVIWSTTVAPSGDLKSPSWDAASRPYTAIQMDQFDDAEKKRQLYELALESWKDADKDKRGERPKAPPDAISFVTTDATIWTLGELMRNNPRGLLLSRDELDGWFQGLTRFAGNKATDRPHWLELQRAGPLLIDRMSRDHKKLAVRRAACSLTGTIQPVILARALDDDSLAAGLAARILMANPPKKRKRWTDAEVSDETAQRYQGLLRALMLLPLRDIEKREPYALSLDALAKDVWIGWFNHWSDRQFDSQAEQAAVLAKLEGYAARLALIHHVVSHVGQRSYGLCPIGQESIRAGIMLAEWFAEEALRIYQAFRLTDEERKQHDLVAWIEARGGHTTGKGLRDSCRAQYPTGEEAEMALIDLVAAGLGEWRDVASGPQGGRPTRAFYLAALETPENPGEFEVWSGAQSECAAEMDREPGEEG
jgi:hypothetical protein